MKFFEFSLLERTEEEDRKLYPKVWAEKDAKAAEEEAAREAEAEGSEMTVAQKAKAYRDATHAIPDKQSQQIMNTEKSKREAAQARAWDEMQKADGAVDGEEEEPATLEPTPQPDTEPEDENKILSPPLPPDAIVSNLPPTSSDQEEDEVVPDWVGPDVEPPPSELGPVVPIQITGEEYPPEKVKAYYDEEEKSTPGLFDEKINPGLRAAMEYHFPGGLWMSMLEPHFKAMKVDWNAETRDPKEWGKVFNSLLATYMRTSYDGKSLEPHWTDREAEAIPGLWDGNEELKQWFTWNLKNSSAPDLTGGISRLWPYLAAAGEWPKSGDIRDISPQGYIKALKRFLQDYPRGVPEGIGKEPTTNPDDIKMESVELNKILELAGI